MDYKLEYEYIPQELISRLDDTTLFCRVCQRKIQIVKNSKFTELQHMRSLVHIQTLQTVFIKHEREFKQNEEGQSKRTSMISEIQKQIEKVKRKQQQKKEKKINSILLFYLEIREKVEALFSGSYKFKEFNTYTQKRYIALIQQFFQDIGKVNIEEVTPDEVLSYLEAHNNIKMEGPLKFLLHESKLKFNEEQKQKFQHLKLQRVLNAQSELVRTIHSYDQHFYRFLTDLFEKGKLLIFLVVFLIYYYRMNGQQILKYTLGDLKKLGPIKQKITDNEPKFLGKKLKELVEIFQVQNNMSDDQKIINPPLTRRDMTRIFAQQAKEMEKNCTDPKYQKFLSQIQLAQIKQVVKKKGEQPQNEDQSSDEISDVQSTDSKNCRFSGEPLNQDQDEIVINLTQDDEIVDVKAETIEKKNEKKKGFNNKLLNAVHKCDFLSKKFKIQIMSDL